MNFGRWDLAQSWSRPNPGSARDGKENSRGERTRPAAASSGGSVAARVAAAGGRVLGLARAAHSRERQREQRRTEGEQGTTTAAASSRRRLWLRNHGRGSRRSGRGRARCSSAWPRLDDGAAASAAGSVTTVVGRSASCRVAMGERPPALRGFAAVASKLPRLVAPPVSELRAPRLVLLGDGHDRPFVAGDRSVWHSTSVEYRRQNISAPIHAYPGARQADNAQGRSRG